MKTTKKQRKLQRAGNAMVKISLGCKNKIGDYIGMNPIYFNKASAGQLPNFVKVKNGVPFVRPALHGC